MYLFTAIDNEYKEDHGESYDSFCFFKSFDDAKAFLLEEYSAKPYGKVHSLFSSYREDSMLGNLEASLLNLKMDIVPCKDLLKRLTKTEAFSEACRDELILSKAQLAYILFYILEEYPDIKEAIDCAESEADPSDVSKAISEIFKEAGETLPAGISLLKKLRVTARTTEYLSAVVYAASEDKALDIAVDMDGGEFYSDPFSCDWEIVDAEEIA